MRGTAGRPGQPQAGRAAGGWVGEDRAHNPAGDGERPPESGVVFGRRAAREVLRSGRPVARLYVAEGAHGLQELVELARTLAIPVHRVPRVYLDRLCRTDRHQGVACETPPAPYLRLEELVDRLNRAGGRARVLVVDHVADPHNLGSLLRSAEAAGVLGAVVAARRAVGLTPTVWKVSAGAAAYVPVARVGSVAAAVDALKRAGFWAVGADPGGAVAYWDADLRGRVALVVGAEGAGLSALVRRRCDVLVRIPMEGRVASLNAGVAGALLMFEAVRQCRQGEAGPGPGRAERVKTGANP